MPKFGAYMRGEGTKGEQGDAAAFNNISATAYAVEGETPTVSVSTSGPNTALDVAFNFGLVRGEAAGFGTEQNATIEVISVTSSPIISVTTDDSSPDNSKVFDFYFGIPHPNDIVNIVQTSTAVEDEGNNEITVYYRNNETATFYVKNGSKGTPAIIEGSVSSTSQLPTTNLHNGMSYIVGTNTKRLYVYLNGNWTDQGPITAAGFGVPKGTLEVLPYEDEFTVNGKIANFESDREALVNNLTVGIEPVQDLHGYDNPWPAGGGKNKLPPSSELTDMTDNGVTLNRNANGTYSLSGTASAEATFTWDIASTISTTTGQKVCLFNSVQNADIAFSFRSSTSASILGLSFNAQNRVYTTIADYSGIAKIRIVIPSGTNTSGITFSPMVVDGSADTTTYAPYSNICPISGHTEAVVTRTGKNLLNKQLVDGYLSINNCLKSGYTYTVSADIINQTATYLQIRRAPKGSDISQNWTNIGSVISNTTIVPRNFTADLSTYDYTLWTTSTYLANIKNVQLELGSTATSYEPYQGQQVTLDLGEERYGGVIDVLTGTMTVTTISENFVWGNLATAEELAGYTRKRAILTANAESPYTTTQYCNMGKQLVSNTELSAHFYCLTNIGVVVMPNTLDASATVQLVYELATPLTYQLTPQQLTTLIGVNNVWADTGDVSVIYTSKSKPEISVTTDPTSPESAKIFYFDFKIPETPGPPGEKGDTPVLELSASTTILPSTSAATVSVTSLSENEFNFNFGIPEAPAPLMSASVSTSTLEPNENANVSVTVNANVFHFDFDIPKGGEGKRGIGISGIQYKETTTTGDIIYSMNFADPEGTTTFSNDFKVPAGPEGIGFYQKITFTSTDGDDYSWINSGENTSTLVIDRSSNKILPLSIYNLNNNNIAATFTVTSSKSGYPYGTIEYETEEKFDGVLYYIGEAPTPQLAIGSVTTYEGAIASVTTERLGNNYLLNFVFPTKGDTGNGISSIEQVSVEGLTTNYRINYTDNSTPFDFAIRNGEQGIQGQQGIQGIQGNPAGFGEPTISVSSISPDDNPTVNISTSGPDTAKIFDFSFGIPSGRAATIEVDPQITIIESTSSPTVNNTGTSTQAQLHFNLLPSMNYICSTTDLNEGDTLPAGTFYFYYEG